METKMEKTPEKEAIEYIEGMENDLPDFDKSMYIFSGVLLEEWNGLETREIIFQALMTGAMLASAKHRKSSNGTEEIINKIMEK
jgi:hypothetical protein